MKKPEKDYLLEIPYLNHVPVLILCLTLSFLRLEIQSETLMMSRPLFYGEEEMSGQTVRKHRQRLQPKF